MRQRSRFIGMRGRALSGGGNAPLVPVLGTPLYYDDFETPAGSTPTGGGTFTGRTNWTVTNAANMRVDAGYAHNAALFGGTNIAQFGAAALPADMTCTWGYGTTNTNPYGETEPWANDRQYFFAWYYDANNYLKLQIRPQDTRLAANLVVGGGVVGGANYDGLSFLPTGELHIVVKDAQLYVRLDGLWLKTADGYPFDRAPLTGQSDALKRIGKVGFNADTFRWAVCYDIATSPAYVTVDPVPAFVPRGGKNNTSGSVSLSGTYLTKTPASGLYRVRDYLDSTVVQDWRALTAFTSGAGVWSGTASIPVGGPYTLDVGYTDTDGDSWTEDTRDVICGALVAYYGQSNSAFRIGRAPDGYAGTDQAAAQAEATGSIPLGEWVTPPGPYAYPSAYELAKRLTPLLGVPVGVGVAGIGGTGIAYLAGDGWDDSWNNTGGWGFMYPSWGGAVEAVIWDQGEGDTEGASDPSAYYADAFLNDLLPRLRSDVGNPTLPVLIDPVGRFASTTSPGGQSPGGSEDTKREQLRQQYLLCLAGDPYVFWGSSHLGLVHSDAYHFTAAGMVEICRRDAWSVAKNVYGVSTHDGMGPLVTSASRSGATITLTLDLNGATALTGPTSVSTGTVPTAPTGSLRGYQVSADNFATLLTISTCTRSGNTIVITLSADPGAAVKVRSMYGWSYDDTSLFYGTYSDTDPIPVWPIMTPLVSN